MEIWHNPRCRKSRETLALLTDKQQEFTIKEYLKETPTEVELKSVLAKLGMKPAQLLRKGEAIFKEKFKGKLLSDDEWISVMISNPKLIERPIVISGNKAEIGRPPEKILDLLK